MKQKQTNTRARKTKKLTLSQRARRHFHLAVVPHKANQYRPHFIRRYSLAAIIVVMFGLQLSYNWSSTGSILGVKANVTAETLLTDANKERQSHELTPLQYNEKLSAAAYYKAKDMFRQQYWAHTAPDGTTPWQWFAKVDYKYAYAGENLAKNFTSADATTIAWMASPKHRANILNDKYTDVGYAVVNGMLDGEQTTIIVSLFGTPVGTASVAGVTTPQTAVGSTTSDLSLMTRFGIALQTITPAALGSIIVAIFAALVAVIAHTYRYRLPRDLQRTWRLHHGAIKAVGMTCFSVVVLLLYSGGQV